VDERGHRLALAFQDGHRAARTGCGRGERAALGVDKHRSVREPVADLQGRVAERPGQRSAERAGAGLAELDDQVGDGRPLPRGDQQTRQQTAGKNAQR
jgi:hypothetical protein